MILYFFLFEVCSIIIVLVFLARSHEHTEESAKLVWKNLFEALRGPVTQMWWTYTHSLQRCLPATPGGELLKLYEMCLTLIRVIWY